MSSPIYVGPVNVGDQITRIRRLRAASGELKLNVMEIMARLSLPKHAHRITM